MKIMLKYIGNFFRAIGLFLMALILLPILGIWGIIEMLIALFYKKRFWKALSKFGDILYGISFVLDVLGNVLIQVPANRLFVIKGGYKFGYYRNSISFVFGTNIIDNTLTPKGVKMAKYIDLVFGKDHCINATKDITMKRYNYETNINSR